MVKKIRVCDGAGCKAWSSCSIYKKLNSLKSEDGSGKIVKIERVPCFNKCGGGASVKVNAEGVNSAGNFLKFRTPREAVNYFSHI